MRSWGPPAPSSTRFYIPDVDGLHPIWVRYAHALAPSFNSHHVSGLRVDLVDHHPYPAAGPFAQVARVVIAIIFVIWLIYLLVPLAGGAGMGWGHPIVRN